MGYVSYDTTLRRRIVDGLHQLANGLDDAGRSRWIVRGKAADGAAMGLVCAIGRDDAGELTVFVTAFWED